MRVVRYTLSDFLAEELGVVFNRYAIHLQDQEKGVELQRLQNILQHLRDDQETFELQGYSLVPVTAPAGSSVPSEADSANPS